MGCQTLVLSLVLSCHVAPVSVRQQFRISLKMRDEAWMAREQGFALDVKYYAHKEEI